MKLTFFRDRNPARDEYTGDAIGFFINEFCLIGVWSKYSQYAIVLFNHAFGIWLEEK